MTIHEQINLFTALLSIENSDVTFTMNDDKFFHFSTEAGEYRIWSHVNAFNETVYPYEYYNEYQQVWKDCGMFNQDDINYINR